MTQMRGAAAELSEAQLLAIYDWMLTGRILEAVLLEAGEAGRGSFQYPGSGQEAAQVGFAFALDPGDFFAGGHRDLLARLVRGVTLEEVMLDLFGKAAGPARGLGAGRAPAPDRGILGVSGSSADGVAVAVGAALAFHCRGEARVALACCGEGATATGAWHEAVNTAAALGLPVVFAVENNQFAGSMPNEAVSGLAYTAHRADGYGIPGIVVDGNDVLEVYAVAREAAERARAGGGPSLIEAVTFRHGGHDVFDPAEYVDPEVRRSWLARDPLPRFEEHLGSRGLLDDVRKAHLEQKVRARIERTLDWARRQVDAGAAPAAAPAALSAEPGLPAAAAPGVALGEALTGALDEALARDDSVVVLGPDAGRRGGPHGITRGLQGRYGARRVIDVPAVGPGLAGAAVGAALCGLHPVIEVPAEALPGVVGLLAGHGAAPPASLPLLIRVPGRGNEAALGLASLPGATVVTPASAAAGGALLAAALRHQGLVLLVEPVSLYPSADAPAGEDECFPDRARLARSGTDVTVVAWGAGVGPALQAAEEAAAAGISAEVLDLQTLQPLDAESVFASVARTGRLVMALSGPGGGEIGAELAARVAEGALWHLDAPVRRVGPGVGEPAGKDSAGPLPADILAAVLSLANT